MKLNKAIEEVINEAADDNTPKAGKTYRYKKTGKLVRCMGNGGKGCAWVRPIGGGKDKQEPFEAFGDELEEVINETIKTVITSTPRPGESLRHRLAENMNSVDQAVGFFHLFDAEEAEKFFAELSDFYSHGISEHEGNNRDFSKISDLLSKIVTIIQHRKGN